MGMKKKIIQIFFLMAIFEEKWVFKVTPPVGVTLNSAEKTENFRQEISVLLVTVQKIWLIL